jgi:hypothetical protein
VRQDDRGQRCIPWIQAALEPAQRDEANVDDRAELEEAPRSDSCNPADEAAERAQSSPEVEERPRRAERFGRMVEELVEDVTSDEAADQQPRDE